MVQLAAEEADHVSFLSGALAAPSKTPCSYEFTAATASIETFLATARVLENVGTSAYLGAAPAITSKAYLAAAGSILTGSYFLQKN